MDSGTSSFQSLVQLSPDTNSLIITNRRPIKTLEYAMQCDPEDVREKKRKSHLSRIQIEEKAGGPGTTIHELKDYQFTEIDEELDDIKFKDTISDATCNVTDI